MAMIDSGAQGVFVDPKFIVKNQLPWQAKDHPYRLSTVDGSPAEYGNGWIRIETGEAPLIVGNHRERINLDVMTIPGHDIILGISWP